MIQPSPDVIKSFAHIAQNVPRVAAYLAEWEAHELTRLPLVARETQQLASGRCQVLQELNKLLSDAPNIKAP